MKINKWMLATMTKEALEEVIERCKPGSALQRMAQAELKARPAKANGNSVKSIEDWL